MDRSINGYSINIKKSVRDAVKTINDNGLQAVLVVDDDNCLKGIVTDGDIRRWILAQKSLDENVSKAMNSNPIYAEMDIEEDSLKSMMAERVLHMVPVIDSNRKVVRIVHYVDLIKKERIKNTVVIMAGGLGSRLKEITKECPKPLLTVGKKPILETIIEGFREQGFQDFYLSVNYKAEMIKEYFEDGEKWGVKIRYLNESKKLGTAGALSLLPKGAKYPIIVSNGDILTKVNYKKLLMEHNEKKRVATMTLREYNETIPYGVVELNASDGNIIKIKEKPVNSYLVNAGLYVLGEKAVATIPKGKCYDMPQLYEKLINDGECVGGYTIDDYWIDIGMLDDLNRANSEYNDFFGF